MRLYILRHGEAVDASEVGGRDADRVLTSRGEQSVRQAAEGMRRLGVQPRAIWTSPYPRAAQTAAITAEVLGVAGHVENHEFLQPGMDAELCFEHLSQIKLDSLMLVGHNPDLEELVEYLISDEAAAHVKLKKGSLASLKLDSPLHAGESTLSGLWTARDLAKLTD